MGEPYCSNASDILISSLRNQRFTITSLCPHPLFMFMVVYPFCFNLTFTFLLFLYQAFCLSQSETFAITSNRELKTMGSRPANPVPNPDESSLSHIKSQDMLADKVVDQWMTVTLKTPLEVHHIKLFLTRMSREKTTYLCCLKKENSLSVHILCNVVLARNGELYHPN